MNTKYKILINNGGSEEIKLDENEFNTIKDAVKYATNTISCNTFQIITIIDWINLINEKEEFGQL